MDDDARRRAIGSHGPMLEQRLGIRSDLRAGRSLSPLARVSGGAGLPGGDPPAILRQGT